MPAAGLGLPALIDRELAAVAGRSHLADLWSREVRYLPPAVRRDIRRVMRETARAYLALRRSAGRAAPYAQVKIVDDRDVEVPRGTVGEIVAAGEHVVLGYWKQPEATAEAVRAGWMHTGDGGYMDERGYVYVVDRIKDMIIPAARTSTRSRSRTSSPSTRPSPRWR